MLSEVKSDRERPFPYDLTYLWNFVKAELKQKNSGCQWLGLEEMRYWSEATNVYLQKD